MKHLKLFLLIILASYSFNFHYQVALDITSAAFFEDVTFLEDSFKVKLKQPDELLNTPPFKKACTKDKENILGCTFHYRYGLEVRQQFETAKKINTMEDPQRNYKNDVTKNFRPLVEFEANPHSKLSRMENQRQDILASHVENKIGYIAEPNGHIKTIPQIDRVEITDPNEITEREKDFINSDLNLSHINISQRKGKYELIITLKLSSRFPLIDNDIQEGRPYLVSGNYFTLFIKTLVVVDKDPNILGNQLENLVAKLEFIHIPIYSELIKTPNQTFKLEITESFLVLRTNYVYSSPAGQIKASQVAYLVDKSIVRLNRIDIYSHITDTEDLALVELTINQESFLVLAAYEGDEMLSKLKRLNVKMNEVKSYQIQAPFKVFSQEDLAEVDQNKFNRIIYYKTGILFSLRAVNENLLNFCYKHIDQVRVCYICISLYDKLKFNEYIYGGIYEQREEGLVKHWYISAIIAGSNGFKQTFKLKNPNEENRKAFIFQLLEFGLKWRNSLKKKALVAISTGPEFDEQDFRIRFTGEKIYIGGNYIMTPGKNKNIFRCEKNDRNPEYKLCVSSHKSVYLQKDGETIEATILNEGEIVTGRFVVDKSDLKILELLVEIYPEMKLFRRWLKPMIDGITKPMHKSKDGWKKFHKPEHKNLSKKTAHDSFEY
jgi:hypothetical protein